MKILPILIERFPGSSRLPEARSRTLKNPNGVAPCLVRLIVLLGTMSLELREADAQPFKLPFTDPTRMFEQAFGEDSEADRKALEKIVVTVEEEQQLGKQILQEGLAMYKQAGIPIVSTGRDVEYLQSLVETLKPQMRHKDRYPAIKVLVARSPKIDARSCPGGTLIFFDGLLDAAGSEAALVGIVGHELSHLDRGHQLLPIKRMKLMEKSFTSPQGLTQFAQSGPSMMKLWARPFRPEDERDADSDGVAWALAAGYDAREMAKLFQKKGGKSPTTETLPWATYFQSHPNNVERVQTINKLYVKWKKQHPDAEPLFIGTDNLAERFSRNQAADAKK